MAYIVMACTAMAQTPMLTARYRLRRLAPVGAGPLELVHEAVDVVVRHALGRCRIDEAVERDRQRGGASIGGFQEHRAVAGVVEPRRRAPPIDRLRCDDLDLPLARVDPQLL